MRQFDTGATRNDNDNKIDYEGHLSPLVLEMYGEYMHRHRKTDDGGMRDSDNWQKGIPQEQYVKSLIRHVLDLWRLWRVKGDPTARREAACAILFNAMGYLYEDTRKAHEAHYPSEWRKNGWPQQ